jgi:DNA polymerase-3 subunit delta
VKPVSYRQIKATPLVLVSGSEELLAGRGIKQLRDQLRAEAPELEVTELDASDYSAGELDEYSSPSLFGEPRLIIIRSVERCTDELIEDGIRYLQDPTEDTVVIFRHNGSSVRGKKLLEALRESKLTTEVACEPLKDKDKPSFVAEEFKAAGKQITQQAIRDLCAAFTSDLAELASACQQLIQDASETIDEKIVEKYYSGRVETTSFKVADMAIAGNVGEALALLRHAVSLGVDPVPIVSAFANKIRLMAKIYQNSSATAAQLGVNPYGLEMARREVRAFDEEGLANLVREVARADAASKGAERDPVFAIERLIILIGNRGKLS